MGRDKALLPHPDSGQPLVLHQLTTLRAAGCTEILLSLRTDQIFPTPLANPADLAAVPRLLDAGGEGPIEPIATALARAVHPLLLVLAVDMPRITPALLRRLLALATTEPARGVVPISADGAEPLCAVYPRTAAPRFAAARAAERRALRPLVAEGLTEGWLRAHPLADEERPAFANWNTPADLPPAPDADTAARSVPRT